jgi:Fic family protein
MENNIVKTVWKPISFDDSWKQADISVLEDLLPSWEQKRAELKDGGGDYEEFLKRLKRQHAIETGVIEKLYDLNEGITQTFIKEGFVESYLQHGDTNIPPKKLMAYLKGHLEAIDFVFDLVEQRRDLSISFIKSLHQLVTEQQDYLEVIDSLGRIAQTRLIKGDFKTHPNNPRRADGTVFEYCPPIHVASEMDRLIELYETAEKEQVHPVIIAAWFHHAFTQIHPFQDGNGRMARLLSSLILIKHKLFPLSIKRTDKKAYIDALEKADEGQPTDLVTLFASVQKNNIENILSFKQQPANPILQESFRTLAGILSAKKRQESEQRHQQLESNRAAVFQSIYERMGKIYQQYLQEYPDFKEVLHISSSLPSMPDHYLYAQQIIEFAYKNDYWFNRLLPRGWFRLTLQISERQQYDLIVTVHHFGHGDDAMAIGGFLDYKERFDHDQHESIEEKTAIPLSLPAYTFSLEADPRKVQKNIDAYLEDVVAAGIARVISELR